MSIQMPVPGAITHVLIESVCIGCAGKRTLDRIDARTGERVWCPNCDGHGRVQASIPLKHFKELLEALK